MDQNTSAVLMVPVAASHIVEIMRDHYGAFNISVDGELICYQHDDRPHFLQLMSVTHGGDRAVTYGSSLEECAAGIGVDCRNGTLLITEACGSAEAAMLSVLSKFGGFLQRDSFMGEWEGVPPSSDVNEDLSEAPRFEAGLAQAVEDVVARFRLAGFSLPDTSIPDHELREAIGAIMRHAIPAHEPAAIVPGPKP